MPPHLMCVICYDVCNIRISKETYTCQKRHTYIKRQIHIIKRDICMSKETHVCYDECDTHHVSCHVCDIRHMLCCVVIYVMWGEMCDVLIHSCAAVQQLWHAYQVESGMSCEAVVMWNCMYTWCIYDTYSYSIWNSLLSVIWGGFD